MLHLWSLVDYYIVHSHLNNQNSVGVIYAIRFTRGT